MKIDVYPYFFLQAQNKIIQIIQGITILVICIEIHQDLSVHVKLKVQSILQENLWSSYCIFIDLIFNIKNLK
jgi:hypothetical protein